MELVDPVLQLRGLGGSQALRVLAGLNLRLQGGGFGCPTFTGLRKCLLIGQQDSSVGDKFLRGLHLSALQCQSPPLPCQGSHGIGRPRNC